MTKRESGTPSDDAPWRGVWSIARTVLWTSAISTAVAASLLTFPSSILRMTAFWLVLHTVSVARGKPGWLPLATCVLILVIKRVYWPPTFYVFVATALLLAGIRLVGPGCRTGPVAENGSKTSPGPVRQPGPTETRRRGLRWCGAGLLWLVWGLAAYQWHQASSVNHPVQMHPTKAVVCIGDSLTSGVHPYGGYPNDLANVLPVPVVNLGQPGITAEDALKLLPKLREANPQVVVIELGGHDFLRGRGRAATKSDLEKLIAASRGIGAEVVLMEVPRGFMVDPFAGLERELARKHDLELISDSAIRNLVLFSPHAPPGMWIGEPHLSNDGLHPNANGNTYLAERVAKTLARMYGIDIRADLTSK